MNDCLKVVVSHLRSLNPFSKYASPTVMLNSRDIGAASDRTLNDKDVYCVRKSDPLTTRADHVRSCELSAHGIVLDAVGLLKLLQLLLQEPFHAHVHVFNFLNDGTSTSSEHFSFQLCQKKGIDT